MLLRLIFVRVSPRQGIGAGGECRNFRNSMSGTPQKMANRQPNIVTGGAATNAPEDLGAGRCAVAMNLRTSTHCH